METELQDNKLKEVALALSLRHRSIIQKGSARMKNLYLDKNSQAKNLKKATDCLNIILADINEMLRDVTTSYLIQVKINMNILEIMSDIEKGTKSYSDLVDFVTVNENATITQGE